MLPICTIYLLCFGSRHGICVRGIDVAYLYDQSFVFWKPSCICVLGVSIFPLFSIGVSTV
jgi:hypothetical protein